MTTKPLSGKPGPGPHMMFFFRGEAVVVPVEKADRQTTLMLANVDIEALDWIARRNQMKSRSAAMRALIASHCLACGDLPEHLRVKLTAQKAALLTLPLAPPEK